MNVIASAAVDQLTSASLEQFRQMVMDARRQQHQIQADLAEANATIVRLRGELRWRQWIILRQIFAKRIEVLREDIHSSEVDSVYFRDWLESTVISVDFNVSAAAKQTYGHLVGAYDRLRHSAAVWDVTADRSANRVVERTTASRIVNRVPVRPDYAQAEFVQFQGRALRLPNALGEDLLIYPGMILMERRDGAFALIDLRQVTLQVGTVQFIEEEAVPPDTRIVGETWAKANKDGSPDRRFADNYRIPICEYGSLRFTSNTGLNEEYQFSSAAAALQFGQAVDRTAEICEIQNLDSVWVTANVPERDVAKAVKGSRAQVTIAAYPNRVFPGVVQVVGNRVDPKTRAMPVQVLVENRDGALRSSMFARVSIGVGSSSLALAVPRSAIADDGERRLVYVAEEGGKYEEKEVEIGRSKGDLVEIVRGLEPGARIVTKGAFVLKSEKVKGELKGHEH